MKTFEQHILDISGCPTIEIADNAVSRNTMLNWATEAAKRYATQAAQDALNRAARHCEGIDPTQEFEITNTQIALP